jgi:PAS domain S-box-containing protein
MSNAPSPIGGLPDYPSDGALMDGNRRVERRHSEAPGDSPIANLGQLPAVVALERLPVPALAMSRDGVFLFANAAFAEMVGYEQDGLAGSALREIFDPVPTGAAALSAVDAFVEQMVQLRHREGWTVQARMSTSATTRPDDPIVLLTFDNVTERLWVGDHPHG